MDTFTNNLPISSQRITYLVDYLHKPSLLRVHGFGLDWPHPKEFGVKEAWIVVDEIRVQHVAPAVVCMVRVIEALGAEATVGDLAADISRLVQKVPQLGRGARVPREATGTADDDDWLVCCSGSHLGSSYAEHTVGLGR